MFDVVTTFLVSLSFSMNLRPQERLFRDSHIACGHIAFYLTVDFLTKYCTKYRLKIIIYYFLDLELISFYSLTPISLTKARLLDLTLTEKL